jgi:hypothetical protein
MTSLLTIEQLPSEADVFDKQELQIILSMLGGSPKAIADRLRRLSVSGQKGNCHACPIHTYLSNLGYNNFAVSYWKDNVNFYPSWPQTRGPISSTSRDDTYTTIKNAPLATFMQLYDTCDSWVALYSIACCGRSTNVA